MIDVTTAIPVMDWTHSTNAAPNSRVRLSNLCSDIIPIHRKCSCKRRRRIKAFQDAGRPQLCAGAGELRDVLLYLLTSAGSRPSRPRWLAKFGRRQSAPRSGLDRRLSTATLRCHLVALSRRKQGFESPRERHEINHLTARKPSNNTYCLVSVPAALFTRFVQRRR
jgi:hypothetical protein